MYLSRTAEKEIPLLSQDFKVVLVSGMRQVGKSSLLSHLAAGNRDYVTLDNMDDLQTAQNAPNFFFKNHPLPVFVDEIQRVPQLFLQVKYEVDKSEACGQVWLSGSQRFALMKGVGDSLAGRLFELHLMPLSLYELQGKGLLQEPYVPNADVKNLLDVQSDEDLWQTIWRGCWPKLLDKDGKRREQFFSAYLTTFLERDIRELCNIDELPVYMKFMQALAIRTGQELRINKLAQFTGVSEPTAKRWLYTAQASGLIYMLEPFSTNLTKQLTKSPKVYMTDCGLAAYLCKIASPEALKNDTNAGAFFETFVVTELLKSWRHNGREPHFYFYRDPKTQAEIDLIIESDGIYHPVEIKMSQHPTKDMVRHFDELKKFNVKTGIGALICRTPQVRYLTNEAVAHNLWQI